MPNSLPNLSLTQGQLLWALEQGREPGKLLKDQVRYLRQLGIPKNSADQVPGSGNRVRYDFHDLVELGLGVTALKHRFKPKDISAVLVDGREQMRTAIEMAWRDMSEEAISTDWIKSRGAIAPLRMDDFYLRLHERRAEKWGKVDIVGPAQVKPGLDVFTPIEIFEDGEVRVLFPLQTLMLPWVAWALEAAPIRTGPR